MSGIFKWAIAFLLVVFALIALALSVSFLLLKATVQKASGEIELLGIEQPVSVIRDKHGVPHITGQSRNDVAAALGFVHAQDRMWQMEFWRRTAQGRVSEILGPDAVEIDTFMRTLDFSRQVQSSYPQLQPQTREVLKAYAAGVNRFLAIKPRSIKPSLPPEFVILGHSPEPWSPSDSLLILKLLALEYSSGMADQLKRLRLAAVELNPHEIEDVFTPTNGSSGKNLPSITDIISLNRPFGLSVGQRVMPNYAAQWLDRAPKPAVDLRISALDAANAPSSILALQMIEPLSAPSKWHLAHLQWTDQEEKTLREIGATIPGLPLIIIGASEDRAWVLTPPHQTQQQVFIEQVRGNPAEQILTLEGWKDIPSSEVELSIRGEGMRKILVQSSPNGPLLPRNYGKLNEILATTHAASLRWSGLSPDDQTIDALLELAAPASQKRVLQQMTERGTSAFELNLFSKDQKPVRLIGGRSEHYRTDNRMAGYMVQPAWVKDLSTRLAIANWPRDIDETVELAGGTRQSLVFDQNTATAPHLLQLRDVLSGEIQDPEKYSGILSRLQRWNGAMELRNPAPLIMLAWQRALVPMIFDDELGPQRSDGFDPNAKNLLRIFGQGGARNWCDNTKTPDISETCDTIVTAALDAAMKELRNKYGPNFSQWHLGQEHRVRLEHPVFSNTPILSELFNLTSNYQTESGIALKAEPELPNSVAPYAARRGAGLRLVIELNNLQQISAIHGSGQSGNPMSPNYSNFSSPWSKGQYLEISTDQREFSKRAQGTWVLRPQRD